MKVEHNSKFEPIELTVTIESFEEFKNLFLLFQSNVTVPDLLSKNSTPYFNRKILEGCMGKLSDALVQVGFSRKII